ncbi:MAG TPA: hypothetical protein VM899_04585 [Rubellimicrobium sp.]|nr:hypothetical protein [Rubellimicrobium sp.]
MPAPSSSYTDPHTLARGLGWFSIALGLGELLAPGSIKGHTGVPGPKGVVSSYGLREIATGAVLLAAKDPVPLVWARVAGDLLDIATIAPALHPENPHRTGAASAMGFVLLATATDLAVALQGSDRSRAESRLLEAA